MSRTIELIAGLILSTLYRDNTERAFDQRLLVYANSIASDLVSLLGSDAAGPEGWRLAFGGDGGFSAVHPTQTGTWLMESQWSNVVRTTNGGLTIFQSRTGLDPVVASGLGPDDVALREGADLPDELWAAAGNTIFFPADDAGHAAEHRYERHGP